MDKMLDEKTIAKIRSLVQTSKGVLSSCSLDNGAIVAANSDKAYYPKDSYNYRYVWPRDAAFVLMAADTIGLKIHNNFMGWLLERAEDLSKDGLLLQNYYTNGPKRWHNFQPDSNGLILLSIYMHYGTDLSDDIKKVVRLLADGLNNVWDKTHFNQETQEPWERRYTFPDLDDNFTYSLAATAKGLKCAYLMLKDERYKLTAEQMNNRLGKHGKDYFFRSFGRIVDERIDASMLFLTYPLEMVKSNDPRMRRTVELIEERLVKDEGVKRFEHDEYDGWRIHGKDRMKGAGTWPILTFTLSIYHAINGDKDKALEYYLSVVDKVDNYIPEQFFDNDIQVSVTPLAWSHAMFLLATEKLGIQWKE